MKAVVILCLLVAVNAAPSPSLKDCSCFTSDQNTNQQKTDNNDTKIDVTNTKVDESSSTKIDDTNIKTDNTIIQTEDKKIETDFKSAKILSYDNDNKGLGMYKFSFEQSDGTKHNQEGNLINEGSNNEYLSVKGSFTFIGPDGVTYTITYTADENGYKPEIDQGPGGAVPDAVVASMLG